MQIKRLAGSPANYLTTFEKDPISGFRESTVAYNATSFSCYDQEVLGIGDEMALDLAILGAAIMNYTDETGVGSITFQLSGLRSLASCLRHYRDNTKFALAHLPANGFSAVQFSARRIEGQIAGAMYEVIASRGFNIPTLKTPPRLFPIGFSR